MPIYPSSSGFIGSLLRTIQEERSKAPHVLPPAAEPQAPIRSAVQAPLESPIAPESPGSARVISVRPEGAPPTGEAAPAGQVTPARSLVGGIGGQVPRVVPPVVTQQIEDLSGRVSRATQEVNQRIQELQRATQETQAAADQAAAANRAASPASQAAAKPTGTTLTDARFVLGVTQREEAARQQEMRDIQRRLDQLYKERDALLQTIARRKAAQPPAPVPVPTPAPRSQPQSLFQRLTLGNQSGARRATNSVKRLLQRFR